MGKKSCRLSNDSGSVQILEMILIFPLVLLCLFFLIYLCSYIMQGIFIYNNAQRIAVAASREAAFPGYGYLYGIDGVTSQADFNWKEGDSPSIDIINKLMKEHNPYRYWGDDFLSSDMRCFFEKNLEKLIVESSFLASSDVKCTITVSNNILNQQIEVRVVKYINMPKIIRHLAKTDNISIDVTAAAVVGDSAEFIRNTDMIFDLKDYMFDNLKIGKSGQTINEKIGIYKQKFSDINAKLGLG